MGQFLINWHGSNNSGFGFPCIQHCHRLVYNDVSVAVLSFLSVGDPMAYQSENIEPWGQVQVNKCCHI